MTIEEIANSLNLTACEFTNEGESALSIESNAGNGIDFYQDSNEYIDWSDNNALRSNEPELFTAVEEVVRQWVTPLLVICTDPDGYGDDESWGTRCIETLHAIAAEMGWDIVEGESHLSHPIYGAPESRTDLVPDWVHESVAQGESKKDIIERLKA